MRIVSLIASATEIVCALGCAEQLVGRSHECDYPPGVATLPTCTGPRFDIRGSSAEIDARVQGILQAALSVYQVDADRLRALQPDVIVTQSQCEVCAVSARDVQQAVCAWLDRRPTIVALAPNALADVWASIQQVADALQVSPRGRAVVARLQERVDRIAGAARQHARRPTVACLEWLDPLMAAGNWLPELVDRAGGVNLFGVPGRHAPKMTWEELVARDPDVIVALPCGWDIPKARQEIGVLQRQPEWPRLRAVQAGQVFLADGNQYFNRPGPRLVESLEILAEILHPETFHFGHEGTGWERLAGADKGSNF